MRMALAQFTPMAGDVDGNLSQMQALLGTGALQHADLVCFPELCLPGYLLEPAAYTAGFLADLARAAETLEQTARERQVRIVYGTAEACAGALRNVVVITDPARARTRYAKTHMVQAERIAFTPGNHLVLTGDGVLALGCCYDLAFPGFCAGLADAGARRADLPDGVGDPARVRVREHRCGPRRRERRIRRLRQSDGFDGPGPVPWRQQDHRSAGKYPC